MVLYTELNGERKKVSCGPCIKGHRSSKCTHSDRVLMEVRKPGRPLSSCPHPAGSCNGSCSCPRQVFNYGVPKTTVCTANKPPQAGPPATNGNRVAKHRYRKSTTIPEDVLEKELNARELTVTPPDLSHAPSEKSTSSPASAYSSASSTPYIQPTQSFNNSQSLDLQLPETQAAWPSSTKPPGISNPSLPRYEAEPRKQQQGGSCCGGGVAEPPKPVQVKKSCCSGKSQPAQVEMPAQMYGPPHIRELAHHQPGHQQLGHQQSVLQQLTPIQAQPYNGMDQGFDYYSGMPKHTGINPPLGFNTPIYNHIASAYQQPASTPMAPTPNQSNLIGNTNFEPSCQCGDSCTCFGCSIHPDNATMINYVRQMDMIMRTDTYEIGGPPTYDMPPQSQHLGFGGDMSQTMPFYPSPNNLGPVNDKMAFQANTNASMNPPNGQPDASNLWQQPSTETATMSNWTGQQFFDAPIRSQKLPVEVKAEEAASAPSPYSAGSPGSTDDDATIISPGRFTWQHLDMGGCNDLTGACMCGPGCKCVGCLTHDRNGAQQEPAYPAQAFEEQESLLFPANDPLADYYEQFVANNLPGTSISDPMTGAFSDLPA